MEGVGGNEWKWGVAWKGKGGAGIVEETVLINLNLSLKMSCPITTQLKY